MGQKNSKVMPEENNTCIVCSKDLGNSDLYFDCKRCNIKIHSCCKSYYLSHRLEFPVCIYCQN